MDVFLRVDINIVAMILLLADYFIAYKCLDRNDKLNTKFLRTSLVLFIGILFETLTCIINRRPENWLVPVSVLLHLGLFAMAPVMAYMWYIFLYSWVSPMKNFSHRKNIPLFIPIILNLFITVLSPAKGWVFHIDAANIYHRGPLFYWASAITYLYLFFGFILVMKKRKKIIKQEFLPLAIFGILPMVGGVVQTFFYGSLLMWSSCAFSFVIVFNFLQQRMVNLDNLTGAWTRGSFEFYIQQRIKNKNDEAFGTIVIDLDGLKQINDQYGHLEGDEAIKKTVQLIKITLSESAVIARFGGDEFIVIVDCISKEDLMDKVEEINSVFIIYNKSCDKKYKLEYSLGADIYSTDFSSVEQFLHHVDTLMYDNKRRKKKSAVGSKLHR